MLDRKVTIYVPGTTGRTTPDPEAQATWVDMVLEFLAVQFGGGTADAPSTGAWMSPEHGLIKEPVVKVYSYTNVEGLQNGISAVLEFVGRIAREMGQEAVSVDFDGSLRFVTPEDSIIAAA